MAEEKVEAPETIWAVQISNGEWVQTWPAYAKENGGIEYVRIDRAPNTRQRAERAAMTIADRVNTAGYIGEGRRKEITDIIAAEFEK